MVVSKTLNNGAKVLASRTLPDGSGRRVVLCRNPVSDVLPWVTWKVDKEGNAESGHYWRTREVAERDYAERW